LIIALLGIGAAALLLKGLVYEGALILGVVLAVLVIMRQEFRRKASLVTSH
jgi:lysylphosphatidylglycerol synthetase-like protein (DUF2156 family)